jgi:hypothetical protein
MTPAVAEEPHVVVVVAQLPCGTCVRIELTLRLASIPARPPTAVPLVIA